MPQENQIEKIEQYHSGRMTSEEGASFEKELASDPSLKAESDFQSNIIDGIKEYRKSQLKTRLDAIDISPGWIEFAQQSTLVKSFGGVAIATVVGSGVYFLAETKEDKLVVPDLDKIEYISTVDAPVFEEPTFEWKIIENLASQSTEQKAEIVENPKEIKPAVAGAKANTSQNETVAVVEKKEESFAPKFEAPDAGDITDNSDLSSSTLDEVPSVATTKPDAKPIVVETKNTKNSKIKYKYYDGKLFLNGNFSEQPYEILEINSSTGRRIYLLHLNKYYEIKINDRLSELPEVTDIKLIRELRLIKANKVD